MKIFIAGPRAISELDENINKKLNSKLKKLLPKKDVKQFVQACMF